MNKEYRETMFSGLGSIIAAAAGIFSLGLFASMVATDTVENAAMIWFLPVTGLFLLLVAVNFAFLQIKISARGVTANYGVFSHTIPAEDIADYYKDDASQLAYGGFGLRFGWKDGRRRIVFNTIGTPGIAIRRHSMPDRELVFSTKNPEAVIKALKSIQVKR